MATISADNSEFAVATGSNVNANPGRFGFTSDFDTPTNEFTDLVITSDAADTQPNLFEVGETYTLSYTAPGGTTETIEATVVRSDPLGSNAGIVVFEGTDPTAGDMQFVWTPDFDVDQWVQDNLPGASFYTYDRTSPDYGHICFAAGTPIATPSGLRPVECLTTGDAVLTRDGGAKRLIWTGRQNVLGTGASAPVRFAPGVVGNTVPLRVSQQHRMLLCGASSDLLFGTDEVLAPAKALLNGDSIRLAPCRQVVYVHLLLETHEVLFAAGGAAAESLYLGDVSTRVLEDGAMGEIGTLFPQLASQSGQRPFDMQAARMLLRGGEALALARDMGLGRGVARARSARLSA